MPDITYEELKLSNNSLYRKIMKAKSKLDLGKLPSNKPHEHTTLCAPISAFKNFHFCQECHTPLSPCHCSGD